MEVKNMKKFRQLPATILAVILSLTLVFGVAACGETYTVSFETNGGSAVAAQTVSEGKATTLPTIFPITEKFVVSQLCPHTKRIV